jgi:hypothetical protein
MSSDGPPPAPHIDAIDDDARWLFPLERAPPPPLEGCQQCGFGDPAPLLSNGSQPNPSPPQMSCMLSSSISMTHATTSSMQMAASATLPPSWLEALAHRAEEIMRNLRCLEDYLRNRRDVNKIQISTILAPPPRPSATEMVTPSPTTTTPSSSLPPFDVRLHARMTISYKESILVKPSRTPLLNLPKWKLTISNPPIISRQAWPVLRGGVPCRRRHHLLGRRHATHRRTQRRRPLPPIHSL